MTTTTEDPLQPIPGGFAAGESEIVVVKPYGDPKSSFTFTRSVLFEEDEDDLGFSKKESDNENENETQMSNGNGAQKYTHYESDANSDEYDYEPEIKKPRKRKFSDAGDDNLILNLDDNPAQENTGKPNQATAPSFDEVKDDADEGALVATRGEGRYFGFEVDTTPIICRKCGGKGHISANCTTTLCENCGAKNEHTSRECPKTKRCSRCGQLGHIRKDCTGRAISIYCRKCQSHIHTSENCPSVWRAYILDKNRNEQYPKAISCYNCGASGHYGDNCVEPRRIELRFCEDSAFNGNLLPPKYREKYQHEITRIKRDFERARRKAVEDSIPRKDRRAMNRERDRNLRRGNSSGNLSNGSSGSSGRDYKSSGNYSNGRDYYRDSLSRRDDYSGGNKRARRY